MIYVSEYKAPHKLTAPHLRLGLRSMNIYKEFVNRKTIPAPADPEERLEFSLLTPGEAIVFFKIDWEEPDTLYYHLAEPKSEAAAHPDNLQSCAVISQYFAFSLVALGSLGQRRGHGQDEREWVKMNLRTQFDATSASWPRGRVEVTDKAGSIVRKGVSSG
ncbi:hypothetical protein F4823DRAFT_629839 [Ustulina deusta]|nr:hypothetical protein F4823DRAFT_629839 [Ustulina deusta]